MPRTDYYLPLTEEPMLRVPTSKPIVMTRYDRVGRFVGRAILTVIVLAVTGLVLAHAL